MQSLSYIYFLIYTGLFIFGIVFLIRMVKSEGPEIKQLQKYLLLSIVLFIIIDFLVAYRDNPLFLIQNPYLLIPYFGWCFLFGYLNYIRKWRLLFLVLLFLVLSISSEFAVLNPFLFKSWSFVLGLTVPILWLEYFIITIVPMWIVKRGKTGT